MCYTQHALRLHIDSEIDHIRHFIKIQFVNKGIEFNNLPNIFKDKSVISSIHVLEFTMLSFYKHFILFNKSICSWCFLTLNRSNVHT